MQLQALFIQNFRSYKQYVHHFKNKLTVFVGANGIGKTNLLEAVQLLSLTESFRVSSVEDLIKLNTPWAKVAGKINEDKLEILLTPGVLHGKKTSKKRFFINSNPKTRKDFLSRFNTVLFEPRDIELITSGPSRRRKFLDQILSQVDWQYAQSLLLYQKGLRQRNKLLKDIVKGRAKTTQLEYWNRMLVKNGDLLQIKRADLIIKLNNLLQKFDFGQKIQFSLVYKASTITAERLQQHLQAELALARTLIGPQKDDFEILFKHPDLQGKQDWYQIKDYASRGQQRLGVLAIKLSELEFINKSQDQAPVLLLDDIFSELDDQNDQLVLDLIKKHQTIITATEINSLKNISDAEIVRLG